MNRRTQQRRRHYSFAGSVKVVLFACFISGAVLGTLASLLVEDLNAVESLVSSYSQAASRESTALGFVPLFWDTARIPLLVILLGQTKLRFAFIPAIFLYRGFTFSFCVAVLYLSTGLGGYLCAIILIGLSALMWCPALFMIGFQATNGRGMSVREPASERQRSAFCLEEHSYVIGCVLLIAGALFEYCVVSYFFPFIWKLF